MTAYRMVAVAPWAVEVRPLSCLQSQAPGTAEIQVGLRNVGSGAGTVNVRQGSVAIASPRPRACQATHQVKQLRRRLLHDDQPFQARCGPLPKGMCG